MILYYLLISVMPMMRHPIWNSFVGGLTVIKYMGGACLAYAIYYWLAKRKAERINLVSDPPAVLFLFFVTLASASSLFMGAKYDFTAPSMQALLSFVMLFVITAVVVDSVERVRWAALTAVGSIAFASLYVVREWQKYHNIYADFRPKDGAVGDPNYFTLSALLCLPIALYLMLGKRPKWERWFCFGCLAISVAGMTVAASRGGFLGLVPTLAVIFLHASRRVKIRLVTIVFVLSFVAVIFPQSPVQRLIHPQRVDDRSSNTRLALWRAGVRMAVAHPFTGVGLGNFKPMAHLYQDKDLDWPLGNIAHNTYVEVGAEMGVPMLMLFIGILFSCYWSAGRTFRRASRLEIPILPEVARGIQAGLMGYLVAAFFISAHFQKLLWELIFLTFAMSALVDRYAAAKRRATSAPLEPALAESLEPLLPLPIAAFVPAATHWSIDRGPTSTNGNAAEADSQQLLALKRFVEL